MFRRLNSQKGFTLIELLVVAAILGILAVIAGLAVTKFISTGTIEGANLEAHQVEIAVVSYMADNSLSDFDGVISPTSETGAEEFLSGIGRLQAEYTVENGQIVSAEAIEGGKWDKLEYSANIGWYNPE